MAGSSGKSFVRLSEHDLIPLPPGSELFLMPGRLPVGFDPIKKRFLPLEKDPWNPGVTPRAVAAFLAPAYTQTITAAFHKMAEASVLPLFSYTAVGWKDRGFLAAAFRVDPLQRQDLNQFDQAIIQKRTKQATSRSVNNRLLHHLANCALINCCPAARNLMLGRWEAPIPTSPSCNSRCIGCISYQPDGIVPATQERIKFVPEPGEIADVAVPHLESAPEGMISFGQGCEGEPLLQGMVLEKAIHLIRKQTSRGTINLNTNGSLPGVVRRLCDAGLDSVRISLNSFREPYYLRYYRPLNYTFSDVMESIRTVSDTGRFLSLNLLTFPGLTDQEEELEAIKRVMSESRIHLIQMRNLNIDPEIYLKAMKLHPGRPTMGIREVMVRIQLWFPYVKFGYFNPFLGNSTSS
ncbi:MAG: radical SAM protein [Deltaproteobacteria bacterium]|nr:radical SAM protein [Deltaproteobacteria bacterium]MBW2308845.1 radical SAM protein [Deltaproteobacteria bacterium]